MSRGRDEWGPFARLASIVGLRSAVFFGLQAFVPIYFAVELGTSEAAGNGALSVMLIAGAVGTYVGGRLVDRLGRRPIVVLSMGALARCSSRSCSSAAGPRRSCWSRSASW